MFGNRSLVDLGKMAFSDSMSRVFVIWGILAFVVAYGAEVFGAFLPLEFLQEIPAMREWIGKTKYSYEATVLLSFFWLSLPLVTLARIVTTERGRYLPITLPKIGALFLVMLVIYLMLIRGLGTNIEEYTPSGYGILHRTYYSAMPGMVLFLWCLFVLPEFTLGVLVDWLLGKRN